MEAAPVVSRVIILIVVGGHQAHLALNEFGTMQTKGAHDNSQREREKEKEKSRSIK